MNDYTRTMMCQMHAAKSSKKSDEAGGKHPPSIGGGVVDEPVLRCMVHEQLNADANSCQTHIQEEVII